MAIVYKGVNYTNTVASIPSLAEQGKKEGKRVIMYDKFVLTADLAAGDTIIVGEPLPQGALLLDCMITTGALGGSCTIDVGWKQGLAADNVTVSEAAAPTGFFSALPVSSATVAKAHGNTYEGSFYAKVLAAAVQPVIAEHAVSSGATGIAIEIEINYVSD